MSNSSEIMEQSIARNHDRLDWDAVRRNAAVRGLSRYTPGNSGDFEPPERLLARAGDVAEGMKVVVQRSCQISQEDK
jgi:hypothetical protein